MVGMAGQAALKHPALAAFVELEIFETLPTPSFTEPQIELTHVLIAPQHLSGTVQDDPAVLHDIAVMGDAEGDLGILLDQQTGRAVLGY